MRAPLHPQEPASHSRHELGSPHLDAPVQHGVGLQPTPEVHRPDAIDQFALGVNAARAVLDGPRRERQ